MHPNQTNHIAQLLINQTKDYLPNEELKAVKENASPEEKQAISDRVMEMERIN